MNERKIEQRYTTPYSFGYQDMNDVNKLFASILNRTNVNIKLLFTEKWNTAQGKDYYCYKSKCLDINYKNAFTDIWLISM